MVPSLDHRVLSDVDLKKYFRDERTELGRMVYSAAKDLDASMAGQIQTCIVELGLLQMGLTISL